MVVGEEEVGEEGLMGGEDEGEDEGEERETMVKEVTGVETGVINQVECLTRPMPRGAADGSPRTLKSLGRGMGHGTEV